MLRVKQERSKRRMREILDTAIVVFAEKGLHRTRIQDIAVASGVPPSSIYDYFPSKEDLLYAVPEMQFAEFFGELRQAVEHVDSPRERLIALCRCNLRFIARNEPWARVLFLEVWPSVWVNDQRIRKLVDDFGNTFVEMIKEGVESGEFDSDIDPYMAANVIIGAMTHTANTWLLYRRPRSLAAATDGLIEHIMRLFPPPRTMA